MLLRTTKVPIWIVKIITTVRDSGAD